VSRNKRISARESRVGSSRSQPSPAPHRHRRLGLCLALLGVIVVGAIYHQHHYRELARSDYARARELLSEDPIRSEKFAERAVMNAGGNYPEAQLLRCRALAATGQWDAALGGAFLIKDFSTCDAADVLALGEAALNAGEWNLAEQVLDEAADKSGTAQSRAMELLVRLDLRFQRPDDALRRCRTWQRSVPDEPLPWVISGNMEAAAMNLGAAIADYREALRRSPASDLNATARSSLAKLLVHAGDTAAARREFDLLLASGPLDEKLQLSYAQLLRLEGRNADALTLLDRNIAEFGGSPEALKLRGILYLDEGRLEPALRDLKEAVRGNPFDIAAQHKLGQAHLQSGDPASAQPHLDKSRQMSDALLRLSELEELLRQEPSNAEFQRELKSLHAILGR
jgi:tetratricopeptide (TPR) repeat protein